MRTHHAKLLAKCGIFASREGNLLLANGRRFSSAHRPLRDVSRGGIIDLRHQYGISVAESQTFLPAKRPSAAMSEEKLLPFAG